MTTPSPVPLSPRRKAVYAAITVLAVLFAAELALGLIGIRPMVAVDDPYVGFGRLPLFVEQAQADGTVVLTTAHNKRSLFNPQTFLRDKPANGYRIFCLGGSTTYGHPYDDAMSFCGWLRRFLPAADPSRRWEVINAGGISYASYRVAALMEELAAYAPDLFVVYTGHNEFIEERSYRGIREVPRLMMQATAMLGHSRVFTAVRTAVTTLQRSAPHQLKAEVSERLAKTVGPEQYHRDEKLRADIIAHFRFNLGRMAALARAAGSDIAFVMPSANVKDMSPFKSEHRAGLSDNDLRLWDSRFPEAMATGEPTVRLALLDRLHAIDDRYAALHYERGRALLELGRPVEAEQAFRRALDEDVAPLRVLPALTDAIRAAAADSDVPVIDFAARLGELARRELGHPILGKEWFVDHVHLSIEGYRLLGLELLRHLETRGAVKPTLDWTEARIAAISEQAVASLDAAAHGRSLMNIGIVLGWAGRLEEAHRQLLEARQLMGDELPLLLRLGHSAERLGRPDEAEGFYAEAALIHPQSSEPHRWLAAMAKDMGEREKELRHRRETVRLSPGSAYDVAMLAELLAGSGDWVEAAGYYTDLAELEPEDAQIRLNLGIALANAGQPVEARRQFDEARRRDPASPEAYIGLAGLREAAGDLVGARALYAEAVKRAPDSAITHLNLGANLANDGRLAEAVTHFGEAVRLAPDWPEARLNLARALRHAGREVEAAPHFEAARRLSER